MLFEFDAEKSRSNLIKHGIDFMQAQVLWRDSLRLEVPMRTQDEQRYAIIAQWRQKHWTAIFTYREDRIRIISVRRARSKEVKLYDYRRRA